MTRFEACESHLAVKCSALKDLALTRFISIQLLLDLDTRRFTFKSRSENEVALDCTSAWADSTVRCVFGGCLLRFPIACASVSFP